METPLLTPEEKREIVLQDFEGLLKCSPRLESPEAIELVTKAFHFADKAHFGQFRKGGQKHEYITHPIAVAKIIAEEMGFGKTAVASALLHDTVEDCDEVTLDDIRDNFGHEICHIVDGLTKISKSPNDRTRSQQSETFREMILKMSKSKLIAFIKIADRLHNMRTLSDMKENSKMVKTAESLMVYAPIAHRLGLFNIKKELENLSFEYRQPEEYVHIKEIIDEHTLKQTEYFTKVENVLRTNLTTFKNPFKVQRITKSYYSVWDKMKGKYEDLSKVHNFHSLRIIFEPNNDHTEKQQCFLFYALLTDHFNVNMRGVKDWITHPKTNGFETLLMDVMLEGRWIEVQIMTTRMNEIAMRGFAQNHDNSAHIAKTKNWLLSMGSQLKDKSLTYDDILEIITPASKEIHVFTNDGDLVVMKKGATVLDYAFNVHTELGMKFRAATVNNIPAPYNTVLNHADSVFIIKSEEAVPLKEWLDDVQTSKAKTNIRRYFRDLKINKIKEGRTIFNFIIQNYEVNEGLFTRICARFACASMNELYYKLVTGDITGEQLKRELQPAGMFDNVLKTVGLFGIFGPKKVEFTELPQNFLDVGVSNNVKNFSSKVPFEITDTEGIVMSICCRPVPGDQCIVIKESDVVLEVHKRGCNVAHEKNAIKKEQTSTVIWKLKKEFRFSAEVAFIGLDRMNILGDIVKVISREMELNMVALNVKADKEVFTGSIEMLVASQSVINHLVGGLQQIPDIQQVYRK